MSEQGSATEVAQPVGQQPLESSPTSSQISSTESISVQEKMLSQSEVGKIAGASRKEGHDKGYEKGYQDAVTKWQQNNQSQPSAPKSTDESTNLADLVARQVTETLKKEREAQEQVAEKRRVEEYMTRLSDELKPKFESAQAKYSDFNEAVTNLHLDKAPNTFTFQLLEWVNSVPNGGDVLYDLAKNPQKIGILNAMHAPELARQQIHALSASLQNNQTAQEKKIPKDPLSVVEPSNVGKSTGNLSGQQITEEARRKYRF